MSSVKPDSNARDLSTQPHRTRATLDLMGLPVDSVDAPEILNFMAGVVAENRQAVILHINIYGANMAARHTWLKEYFQQAELVFCDGDGVRLGLRILGSPAPPKVTYNVFLWQLAESCERRRLTLYLLGARPGVADQAACNLRARHPDLRIVGTHDGYFDKQGAENDTVVAEINHLRPDVLLVCFGMPTQEMWIRQNSSRLAVHVLLTGGAALEYGAGVVPVAPRWMVRIHMEWLFRFLREPMRLFTRYIVGNPQFVARVLRARYTRKSILNP